MSGEQILSSEQNQKSTEVLSAGNVHVNNIPDFLVFCIWIPKLLGTRIILDIHDPMPHTYLTKFRADSDNWYYKFLLLQEKLSARFADSVITVHEPLKHDILKKDGIPEEKISVVANFADDRLFKLVDDYRINNPLSIVFHGTIAERFGLEFVLRTIHEFDKKERLHFRIIGEGDYSGRLRELIEELDLQKYVEFDNKFYPVRELPEILSEFHLGLVSYELSAATDYMLPVKMLELQAMGIPVITVKNTAISHYFDGDQCFFYDPSDRQSLTRIFENITADPETIYNVRKIWVSGREAHLWKHAGEIYGSLLKSLNHRGRNGRS